MIGILKVIAIPFQQFYKRNSNWLFCRSKVRIWIHIITAIKLSMLDNN